MKRFAISLITSVLAFTAGLVTASSWSFKTKALETPAPVTVNVSQPCPPSEPKISAPVISYSVTPPLELNFGHNGLRLVPERVQLKSDSRSYDIDVSYPQILATPYTEGSANIARVNQQIKDTITKLYQWPLDSAKQLSYQQVTSGSRNTVNFTYHVSLATDSVLSLNFVGYGYNGGVNRQTQDSFSVNYDLTSGKQLRLDDLFKPGSKYLVFISNHCTDQISRRTGLEVKAEALKPASENFANWQITPSGVTFSFLTCQVIDCKEGDINVEISFDELKALLNDGLPGKFKITYP
jgi:hypothetical protein